MKRILILAIISVLFIGACSTAKTPATNAEKTYKVRKQKFVYAILTTGAVVPQNVVLVKSKASGQIIYFPFEEGDYVKKGSILLKLDPKDEKRNLQLAQANFDYASGQAEIAAVNYKAIAADIIPQIAQATAAESAAAVNLALARKTFERKKQLYAKNIISEEEYDNAAKSLKLAEIDLVSAKAKLAIAKNRKYDVEKEKATQKLFASNLLKASINLDLAKQRLDETVITAPISGIILQKYVEDGQIISSGISAVSGGSDLLKLGNVSKYYILAQVDETDIGTIKIGQECELNFDALRKSKYTGKISRIYPQGQQTSGITVYTVKIDITRGNIRELKPDLNADVKIIITKINDALVVPLSVIMEKQGHEFVLLKQGNTVRRKSVKTAATDGKNFVVESGLKEGDVIVFPGENTRNNNKSGFINLNRRRGGSRKKK